MTYEGSTYTAGLFGGAGVSAMRLPSMLHYELPLDMPQRMLASIDRIQDEPVDIHLGNHPHNNNTVKRRQKQLAEGGNPFIRPTSWRTFLTDLRQKTEKIIAENAETAKAHQIEL